MIYTFLTRTSDGRVSKWVSMDAASPQHALDRRGRSGELNPSIAWKEGRHENAQIGNLGNQEQRQAVLKEWLAAGRAVTQVGDRFVAQAASLQEQATIGSEETKALVNQAHTEIDQIREQFLANQMHRDMHEGHREIMKQALAREKFRSRSSVEFGMGSSNLPPVRESNEFAVKGSPADFKLHDFGDRGDTGDIQPIGPKDMAMIMRDGPPKHKVPSTEHKIMADERKVHAAPAGLFAADKAADHRLGAGHGSAYLSKI